MDPAEAVNRLRDLHGGAAALSSVVALGGRAVPALAELVRERPGPIAEHRRLAVRALREIGTRAARASLGRALSDSLARRLDPVEREAEDSVMSAIASALGELSAREHVDLLLQALAIRPTPGCADALAMLGDHRAIPHLVCCLGDATVRAAAHEALLRFGGDAVKDLSARLCSFPHDRYEGANSIRTRASAAEVLGGIPGPDSTRALAQALGDPNLAVRVAAALELAHTRLESAPIVAVLTEALGMDAWDVAEQAADALSTMRGELALEAVAGVARSEAPREKRARAIRVLARLPSRKAAAALADLRTVQDPHLRDALVDALSERTEVVAREALSSLARDRERAVRDHAETALDGEKQGTPSSSTKDTRPRLTRVLRRRAAAPTSSLRNGPVNGQTWFCQGCWAEVPQDASSCPLCGRSLEERLGYREALQRALRSPEPLTARRAAFLLGLLADPSSVGALTEALDTGDPFVAGEAVVALGRIGTPEAMQAIRAAVTHRWVTVRRAAAKVLHERRGA